VIGGVAPQQRNLIAGNGCVGVELGASGANQVQGNYIGTDASGGAALPNDRDGVYISFTSPDNRVGGEAPQAANLIAFNLDSGVRVLGGGAVRNTISRNRIRGNGGKGIELVAGGNGMLAAPQIGAASPTSASGTTCPGCAVEVFSAADDEGEIYQGAVVADGSGAWQLTLAAGFTGPNLTATATDPQGNTSEFSAPASIVQTATPTPSPTIPPPTPSATATVTATPSASATRTATHSPPPSVTHSRTATPTYTASRSPTASPTASSTATSAPTSVPSATRSAAPSATATASPPPAPCPGDCDGDGAVTIDELVRGVNIALGNQSLDACLVADRDGNGRVTVDELVAAVGAALREC
jgi:parallel beta-helix repeat protein